MFVEEILLYVIVLICVIDMVDYGNLEKDWKLIVDGIGMSF